MVEVLPIETLTLRHRSYLTHDGNMAVVIGPQRETDHITALAGRKGVRITHAAETHTHNNYVSGGLVAAASGGSGRQQVVLGVRRRLERGDGHVANAVHIPFSQPPGRWTRSRRVTSGSTATSATAPWLPRPSSGRPPGT